MKTIIINVDPESPSPAAIKQAAAVIRRGGLVAFPTETVYGLGANAFDAESVRHIFAAKGRPLDNPIIVHIADMNTLLLVSDRVNNVAVDLAEAFWPGPLTLVLPRSRYIPDAVTAGRDTVAIRMPNSPVALQLIRQSGVPVAAPSANLSERPSGTTGKHVFEDLGGKIDMVLDAGLVQIGVESTVLDISTTPPTILRLGAVTLEQLQEQLGDIHVGAPGEMAKRSPGTRHRHYSPRARVVIIESPDEPNLRATVSEHTRPGRKLGLMVHSFEVAERPDLKVIKMPADLGQYAKRLFATFREMDEAGVDSILVQGVAEEGLGRAIMDRIRRAAEAK